MHQFLGLFVGLARSFVRGERTVLSLGPVSDGAGELPAIQAGSPSRLTAGGFKDMIAVQFAGHGMF